MRKREFMRELSRRLGDDMSSKEKQDIINYYDELIEDTIERTNKSEEDVVYDLGPINDIVRKVKPKQEKIHYEEQEEHPEVIEVNEKDIIENKKSKEKAETKKVVKEDKEVENTALKIVLIIITFPFWFGLLSALGACIIGFGAGGIGIGIGGIAAIIGGIVVISTSLTHSLFAIGVGILLIGISLIITPLLIKLTTFLAKKLIQLVKWIANGFKKEAC